MLDARELVATEWKPSRLRDIDEMPDRTVHLYFAMRAGSQAQPWEWWTHGDVRVSHVAHQWAATQQDSPVGAARCGYTAPDGTTDFYRNDEHPCPRCVEKEKGPQARGEIGGVQVGPPL